MRRPLAVGAALALLALTLACGVAGGALAQGAVEPPQGVVTLGDMRLIADIAEVPVCPQLINPGCTNDNPVPPIRIYTIWMLRRAVAGSWEGAQMRRLASYQIGR